MKPTYEQIILQHLEALRKNDPNGGWVREYTIRCMETPFGWIGARGDRSVRDLIKEEKIEKSFDGKYRIVRGKLPEAQIASVERVYHQDGQSTLFTLQRPVTQFRHN